KMLLGFEQKSPAPPTHASSLAQLTADILQVPEGTSISANRVLSQQSTVVLVENCSSNSLVTKNCTVTRSGRKFSKSCWHGTTVMYGRIGQESGSSESHAAVPSAKWSIKIVFGHELYSPSLNTVLFS